MFRVLLRSSRPVLQRWYSKGPKTGVYGLTEQEIYDLRAAWKVVEQASLPVSKLIFKELFSAKPEYQKKFKQYKGRSLLLQSDFVPHMRAVVGSISRIIRTLEDEKAVDQVMKYVATSHIGHAVHREEFMEVGKSVKKTLKALNQKNYSSNMDAALDKFWAGLVEDYVKRIDELNKKRKSPK